MTLPKLPPIPNFDGWTEGGSFTPQAMEWLNNLATGYEQARAAVETLQGGGDGGGDGGALGASGVVLTRIVENPSYSSAVTSAGSETNIVSFSAPTAKQSGSRFYLQVYTTIGSGSTGNFFGGILTLRVYINGILFDSLSNMFVSNFNIFDLGEIGNAGIEVKLYSSGSGYTVYGNGGTYAILEEIGA